MVNYKEIQKMINKREAELEEIILRKKIDLADVPEGKLRATKCRNKYQYFIRKESQETNGTYIKSNEIEQAVRLAQKEYDEKVLRAANDELKIINRLNRLYDKMVVESVPERMSNAKLTLVEKIEKTDEEYIREWLTQDYEHATNFPENLKVTNSKGIKMRSKSEVLISNILDEYNIPYIYEKPLRLGGYKTVLPDFTILDVRNRREVYLEHLGMMDDVEYFAKNLEKIKAYEENGIYVGTQLLITYETQKNPINTRVVRGMIESCFN